MYVSSYIFPVALFLRSDGDFDIFLKKLESCNVPLERMIDGTAWRARRTAFPRRFVLPSFECERELKVMAPLGLSPSPVGRSFKRRKQTDIGSETEGSLSLAEFTGINVFNSN